MKDDIKNSHEFKESLKFMTNTIGIFIFELIAITALAIWPNKITLFLTIVIGFFLIASVVATIFSLKALKRKI